MVKFRYTNEEIREFIACPQFGDIKYGKWGSLKLEQRQAIYDLLKLNSVEDDMIKNQSIIINNLQERIDKAIEYIPKIIISGKSEHSFNEFAVDFQQTKEGRMLLDILKGSDK